MGYLKRSNIFLDKKFLKFSLFRQIYYYELYPIDSSKEKKKSASGERFQSGFSIMVTCSPHKTEVVQGATLQV